MPALPAQRQFPWQQCVGDSYLQPCFWSWLVWRYASILTSNLLTTRGTSMNLVKVTLLMSALATAGMTYAGPTINGHYNGKMVEVSGIGGNVGDACSVRIGLSTKYEGGYAFSINDDLRASINMATVDKAIADGGGEVNASEEAGNKKQSVSMKLRADGSVSYLKLTYTQSHKFINKTIACGDLAKE